MSWLRGVPIHHPKSREPQRTSHLRVNLLRKNSGRFIFVTYCYIYIICMDKQHRSPPDMLSKSQSLTFCLNQWIGFKGKQTLTGTPRRKKKRNWKRPGFWFLILTTKPVHQVECQIPGVLHPFLDPHQSKFFSTGLFTNLSCACEAPCYQQLLVTLSPHLREYPFFTIP